MNKRKFSDTTRKTPDWTIRLLLCVAVLLVYVQSIRFEFTLDDDLFYLKHASVQKGLSGFSEFFTLGSLNQFDGSTGIQPYRPVTLLVFAFEKTFFDNSPVWSHFFNILLYLLLIQLLYLLLKKIFSEYPQWISGLLALAYALHPIHTEVVASVKSTDELLAAIGGFGCWKFIIKKEQGLKPRKRDLIAGCFLFTLALFSKESAISFLIIIPLYHWLMVERKLKSTIKIFIPLLVCTAFFLVIRRVVIGNETPNHSMLEYENVLYGSTGFWMSMATRFEILYHYLKLLVVPWPLNWDYSYNQIPLASWTEILPWAGFILHSCIFVYALAVHKKLPLISFSILFYLIASAPTNNFFMINGATIGERFLFVPSFGFVLFLLLVTEKNFSNKRALQEGGRQLVFKTIWTVLLLLFGILSYYRTSEWSSNLVLFEKGVERSPNSSRAHYSLASAYYQQSLELSNNSEKAVLLKRAFSHFQRSIQIYPNQKLAYNNAGLCFKELGLTDSAAYFFRKAVELDSNYVAAIGNLGNSYQALKAVDSASYFIEMRWRKDGDSIGYRMRLSDLYYSKGVNEAFAGRTKEALQAYEKSIEYGADNVKAINNLASLYSSQKAYGQSLIYLKRAWQLEPKNLMILQNLAAVSFLNRDYQDALLYANKALQINGKLRKCFGVLADTYKALGLQVEYEKYMELYRTNQ